MSAQPVTADLAIALQGVTRVYRGPQGPVTALAGINLGVYPGSMVAVVGRSGSGKTTLLNLIGGLDQPTQGTISVFGETIDNFGQAQVARWRARTLGFVFQNHGLMPTMSALENVELGLRIARVKKRRAIAVDYLTRVGLADRMHHRPAELSGGQRQRVAIARAVAPGNRLLIADEPTAGLDSTTAVEIFSLLRSLTVDGLTVIMATHDPLASRYLDAVGRLEQGQLVSA